MILITGAAGFVGSHLVDFLLQKNESAIIGVDSLLLGKIDNIEHVIGKGFKLLPNDAADPSLEEVFETHSIKTVYHLAANSDIQQGSSDLYRDLNNTFLTTFNIARLSAIYGVNKFFFASTSAVYGTSEGHDLDEATFSLRPISFYGAAKLGSEAYLSAYSHMYDLDICVMRFPNVVGPRATHGVVHDFIAKLKANPSKLEILGDGRQKKPYLYIDDLVKAIDIAMRHVRGYSLYNVAGEGRVTVNQIADIVCEEMGLDNVEYVYSGDAVGWKGDIKEYAYDTASITELGWQPGLDAESSIRKTVREILMGDRVKC